MPMIDPSDWQPPVPFDEREVKPWPRGVFPGPFEDFSSEHRVALIRNDQARGYTKAANQGLKATRSEYVVLLNSDTVVTAGWLNRMIAAVRAHPRIGIVGPLSNTASWQSIPEIEKNGDWASNPLPEGVSIDDMGRWVRQYAGQLYPEMPFLNGFCLLIRREVINEVGYFDEEMFGSGYGEEDDFTLRVRKAGWRLALVDDVYIYHAQSRSYSSERRRQLYEKAGKNLVKKHGEQIVSEGVDYCLHNRVLEGIRARSRLISSREEWIKWGKSLYKGRSVLFVLPIAMPGGGGNVVALEALALQKMGIKVGIYNVIAYRDQFLNAYPNLSIPVHFDEVENLPSIAKEYDAIVATFNPSVEWLNLIPCEDNYPVLGYYIQGFEPLMYSPGSLEYEVAWKSYTVVENLKRFAKTQWTRREVLENVGVDSDVVGVSVDIDLFRPRPRTDSDWTDKALRIAAMVRPGSPYREPRMTMELLRKATEDYGSGIEIILFGTSKDDPEFMEISVGFPWKLAGVLRKEEMAGLLNEVDIFVDFSSHQAMGLTALEAMACGAAVIVPSNGGAVSYARNEVNSMVVDTKFKEASWWALQQIVENQVLRVRLQQQALKDVCAYFPERSAFRILQVLFREQSI